MGYKNREIEWKLLTEGATTMAPVDRVVHSVLKSHIPFCKPIIKGCAADTYFCPPEEARADFVRVRELDEPDEHGCRAQITLKYSDKDGNVNRVEIDLGVSDPEQAIRLLTYMLGDPLGRVTKHYTVYFLENVHTTVSVYKVMKDKRVFVEVEATSAKRVAEVTDWLRVDGGLKFERVKTSLFDMFVAKKDMLLEPLPKVDP